MHEKFELSLWRDYFPNKEVNIKDYHNPGEGIRILTDINELEIGKCYYVHDNGENNAEEFFWRYPCSYTHKELRAANLDKSNPDSYYYWFIDERGKMLATQGFTDREIGVPVIHAKEEKLNVLANENMEQFQGKIYNIHFISKIDGTHTITFEVPRYYFDIYENKRKHNEYLNWIRMKSKLKLWYDDEWYTFVVNSREEKKQKGYILYSFSADDLAVEELSKNGYTLNFTEDEETIELCGMGTAQELSERILAGTDWEYDEDLTTATFQEYEQGTKLNPLTGLYEDTFTPVMMYENHYSPFLKKYVYKTEYYLNLTDEQYNNIKNSYSKMMELSISNNNITKNKTKLPIYYTTETQTDCSGSTQNIIVNNSNFVKDLGWTVVTDDNTTSSAVPYQLSIATEEEKVSTKYTYGLRVKKGSHIYTNNFTTAALYNKPYMFCLKTEDDNKSNVTYTLQVASGQTPVLTYKLKCDTNYCIYSNKNINNLYVHLKDFSNNIVIKEIQLYEVALRDSNNSEVGITQSTLGLKTALGQSNSRAYEVTFDSNRETELVNQKYIENTDIKILLPNAIVTATAKEDKSFFVELYKNLSDVQLATGELTITELTREYILPVDDSIMVDVIQKDLDKQLLKTYYNEDYKNKPSGADTVKTLTLEFLTDNYPPVKYLNRYIKYIDKYGQVYCFDVKEVKFKGKTFYLWKRSILEYGSNKRRLITGSRSNRWNFIQDIAEKFKVYPKFLLLHNPETGEFIYKHGRPIKKLYYVDRFGDVNYSGFKETINVDSINRKILSNEVVTKMYVDNIEANYSDDGYISIQLAGKNPSLENYIYNFRHYLNTGVLDNEFTKELNKHLANLKSINTVYLAAEKERDRLADSVNELKAFTINLETSLEQSKATVEQEKETFSKEVEYYYTGTSRRYLTSNQIADKYGNSVLIATDRNGKVDYTPEVSDKRKYNGFYVLNDYDSTIDDSSDTYVFFSERNDWEPPKGFADYYKKQNGFKTTKKSSIIILNNGTPKLIYGSQKEKVYPVANIPYNAKYTYCVPKGSKYVEINTKDAKTKFDNNETHNLYIYATTSINTDWTTYTVEIDNGEDEKKKRTYLIKISIVDNKEKLTYIVRDRYIKNKTSQSFLDWIINTAPAYDENNNIYTKDWKKTKTRVLLGREQQNVRKKTETIQELIAGVNGQYDLIQQLYTALVQYYDELAKYKKQVIYVNNLLAEKKNYIEKFENKYIQFIKEGYWGEKNYNNNYSYYLDALSVSNDSSIPKVEYTISVIDLHSIPYYRDYKVRIGDETFIADKDMFGVDNTGKYIRERVMITTLDRQLDDDSKNKITVKNYTNRFEDLFQRVSASVTSVEKNEASWSKADILNKNGTVPSSLLTTIHGENAEWVNSSIGLLNSFQQDETGITLTSMIDGNYKMKVTSLGIFLTESALQNNEWTTAISAKGINADVIKTGRLLTNQVTIIADDQPAQKWDSLGISMYSIQGTQNSPDINEDNFTRLDQYGLYMIDNKEGFGFDNNGAPWFSGLTHEGALNRIRAKAKVSITRLGFTYQSNPGNTGINIEIGDFINDNDSHKGIWLYDKTNENTKNTIFKVDDTGIGQIAGFKFDNSRMWFSDGGKNGNDVYNGKKGFVLVPGKGIYMPGIKILSEITEKNKKIAEAGLYMKYGEINGNVKIKKAQLGPFFVYQGDQDKNNNDFLYSQFSKNNPVEFINKTGSEIRKLIIKTGEGASEMLNRKNKIYLGEMQLTKSLLAKTKFKLDKIDNDDMKKAVNDVLKSPVNGTILSIGNNFWMHSSGIGYMGGTIYINGTVYTNKIVSNEAEIGNVNVLEELRAMPDEVVKIVNQVVKEGKTGLGYDNELTGNRQVLMLTTTISKKRTVDIFNGQSFIGSCTIEQGTPCIKFKMNGKTTCLFPYVGQYGAHLLYLRQTTGRETRETQWRAYMLDNL